jgi:nicotinate-nucleotide adenylyltransferase
LKTKKKPPTKTKAAPLKIGVFGGSFNPFHLGHLNSLLAVQKEFGLKEILVIPSYQTPGKPAIVNPSPEERLEMAKLGVRDYKQFLKVDDREIRRGGLSYTVETLRELATENPKAQLHLILGADLLMGFHEWKNHEEILKLADLIVTSRPGSLLPYKKDDLPPELAPLVEDMNRERVVLTTGKTIRYLQLKDKEVSGTEIRKCVRSGLRVDRYLVLPVEKYIFERGLYRPSSSNQLDFQQITKFAAGVLFDKKAFNVKAYDLSRCEAPSEFAVIASGTSTRHVGALGESVVQEIKKAFGLNPLSVEGLTEGRWSLVDFGGLIVHVFYDFVRQEYKLEEIWRQKIDMGLQDQASAAGLSFQS